jgi:hypothetical protein
VIKPPNSAANPLPKPIQCSKIPLPTNSSHRAKQLMLRDFWCLNGESQVLKRVFSLPTGENATATTAAQD